MSQPSSAIDHLLVLSSQFLQLTYCWRLEPFDNGILLFNSRSFVTASIALRWTTHEIKILCMLRHSVIMMSVGASLFRVSVSLYVILILRLLFTVALPTVALNCILILLERVFVSFDQSLSVELIKP